MITHRVSRGVARGHRDVTFWVAWQGSCCMGARGGRHVAMAPSRCIAPALMRYAPPPALAGRRLASCGSREYHSRLFLLWLRSAPRPPPALEARLGPPGGSSASPSRAPSIVTAPLRRGGPLHREVALRQLRPIAFTGRSSARPSWTSWLVGCCGPSWPCGPWTCGHERCDPEVGCRRLRRLCRLHPASSSSSSSSSPRS